MSAPRTGLSGAPLDAARLAVTFAAATASFYVVERPVRAWRAPAWRQVATVPVAAGSWPRASSWARCRRWHEAGGPVHLAAAKVAAPRRSPARGLRRPADDRPAIRAVVSAADPLRILLLGQRGPADAPALGAALASTGEAVLLDESAAAGPHHVAWVLSGGLSQLVASEHPTS